MSLSIKQENFCLAYIETGNASEAYRRSFNAENMKPATITKRASEFINRGDIAGRIKELRKSITDAAKFSLEEHLIELKKLRDGAFVARQFSAAIAAEVNRGKVSGYYTQQSMSGAGGEDPIAALIRSVQNFPLQVASSRTKKPDTDDDKN